MDAESKGRAWFDKICNKLETILMEVDTFTSQSTLCLQSIDRSRRESVRSEQKEVAEDCSNVQQQHHDYVALPSCESPFEPPSHQSFDNSVGDSFKENLSVSLLPDGVSPMHEDYCDGNLTSATTLGDEEEPVITTNEESQITNTLTSQRSSSEDPLVKEMESFGTLVECNDGPVLAALKVSTDDLNLNPIPTEIPEIPVQDHEASMRSNADVIHGKSYNAPLNINALFQEDLSYLNDNALYAVHARTKKLRSFKRKILDLLNSKRRREEEYEQLAIWFGDAEMGSDLVTGEDSKPVEVMDSQWELL